jgi:uncharacterized protein (DUF58 family)
MIGGDDLSAADLARAARILVLRTRREATGLFAGSYASAFRGGGMEFHESRPYVSGDELRSIDWNAMARTGEPFVKRFREERDQPIVLALDVSASMRFGTHGRSKAESAAHAAALLAAAAGRTGDRVGLVTFDEAVRERVQPERGTAHTWHVIQRAVASAQSTRGGTRLEAAAEGVRALVRRRAVVVLISDFREAASGGDATEGLTALADLARVHDLVSIVCHDRREESLPNAGLLRLADPEAPGRSLLLDSSSARARARYRRAWAWRSRRIEQRLHAVGSDLLWLRTDRDPLRALALFFHRRAARSRVRS